MIASEPGRALGIVFANSEKDSGGNPLPPGTVLLHGRDEIRAIPPDSKDEVYFFSVMLWCALCGPESAKYAKDTRLPMFLRNTIANATKGAKFIRETGNA